MLASIIQKFPAGSYKKATILFLQDEMIPVMFMECA